MPEVFSENGSKVSLKPAPPAPPTPPRPLRVYVLWFLIAFTAFANWSPAVTWEEEVPLNTGETIWVHRRVTYSLQGVAATRLTSDMAQTGSSA